MFGALSGIAFLAFTGMVLVFFRSAGTQAPAMGLVFVGIFGTWLVGLSFLFLTFMYLAWRAFSGDVVKVPLIGGIVEDRVLAANEEGPVL